MRRSDCVLLAIVAAIPRLLFLWALPLASGSTDPNCAPDELAHFWVVREISFCRFEPWSPGAFSIYAAFLPSQYMFQAVTLALGRAFHGDIVHFSSPEPLVSGYGHARLGSVLLGLITVAALTRAAWSLTQSRSQTLVAGLVAALLPQLIFVNAYVNGDSFTIAAGALLVGSLVHWLIEAPQRPNNVLLGVAIGLVVLGKVSGYAVIPATVFVMGVELHRRKNVGVGSMQILTSCVAVAGPVLLWNAARSGGDVLGLRAYNEFLARYWTKHVASGPDSWRVFFSTLGMSTFGTFRNMDLFLPIPIYWSALLLTSIGLLLALSLWRNTTRAGRIVVAWLLASATISMGIVWWNSWVVDFQPQGRYLLLIAACIGMTSAVAPMRVLPRASAQIWVGVVLAFLVGATAYSAYLILSQPCIPYPPAGVG